MNILVSPAWPAQTGDGNGSYLREFVRAVFPKHLALALRWVAMFRAYLDRGQLSEGIVSVAGYVAPASNWERFEQNWREVMDAARLTTPFHMTDFENFRGPFEDWTPRDKAHHIRRVAGVIRRAELLGVAATLLQSDFDVLVPKEQQNLLNAYGVLGGHAMGHILRVVKQAGSDEPVAFVFEMGDEGAHRIYEGVMRAKQAHPELAQRLHFVSFEKKENMWGLQAADVWAYESAKYVLTELGMTNRPVRRSFARLVKRAGHVIYHLDADQLRQSLFRGASSGGEDAS